MLLLLIDRCAYAYKSLVASPSSPPIATPLFSRKWSSFNDVKPVKRRRFFLASFPFFCAHQGLNVTRFLLFLLILIRVALSRYMYSK